MKYRNIDPEKHEYYKSIFNKYDKNGSGAIEFIELKEMLKSDDEIPQKIVKKVFGVSDKDKDGKINLNEFIDMIHDRKFKDLFGQYIDTYVNLIVPRNRSAKFKPIGRKAPVSDETLEPDGSGSYEASYSCCPPPIALIIMSLLEIACFVTDSVTDPKSADSGTGVTAKILIYDPFKRHECWRFLTYMFVHIGYVHLTVNLIVQIMLGIPLEMANQWWSVLTVYFSGVVAGSLVTSILDPNTYLAGASGGVYAILTAHLSTIIMNWSEMTFPGVQLFIFVFIISVDVGTAIHNRYYLDTDHNIGYAAHFGGALAGLLVGIWVLKNIESSGKERFLWWAAFIFYILLMGTAIMLNIFWTDNFATV